MCLFEFDQEKYERTIRDEGLQQGLQQGMQQGIKNLIVSLFEVGVKREIIYRQIIERYFLSEQEAQQALDKYLPTLN